MISRNLHYQSPYRAPVELRSAYRDQAYTLGAVLQALLLAWGLFAQNSMVLLARTLQIDNRILTVPARATTAALAVALIVALFFRPNRMLVGWPMLAFLAFWAAFGTRLAIEVGSQIDIPLEMGRFNYRFIAQMAFGGCFLPALALLSGTCWEHHNRALWACIYLCALAAIAMFNLYGERMVHFQSRINAEAMVGDVEAVHPLALGYTGSVMCVLGLYLLFCLKSNLAARGIFAVGLLGTGIALLVGSASRGPMIAVAASALALFASLGKRFDFGRLGVLAITGGLVAFGIVWFVEATGSTLLDRLFGIAGAIEAGEESAGRVKLYAAAWSEFLRSPVFGSQLTMLYGGEHGYPHNLIIGSLMSVGLVGTVPLLALLWFTLKASMLVLARAPALGWLPLLFVLYLTGGMFSWAIYTNVELWLTMASTLSVAAWIRQKDRAEEQAGDVNL